MEENKPMGKIVGELWMRKIIVLILTALVLAYFVTSIGFWLVENVFSLGGRFFFYYSHNMYVEGKGPAPNQYRFVPYLLVEKFFKHIPIRWYCSPYLTVKRWAGFDNNPSAVLDNKLNLDSYLSLEDRDKLANDVGGFIKEKLLEITNNVMTTNILLNIVNNLGWKTWFQDPFEFVSKLIKQLPYEFTQVFDDKSDLNKVIYGYATMRFFATIGVLLLLYFWMRTLCNELVSYLSMFAYSIFLAFSYGDFLQQEFHISLLLFILGVILIYKRKPWWSIFILVVIQSFVRTDHAFFIAVIYGLYNFPWNKDRVPKIVSVTIFPILMTYLLAKVIFPNATYYTPLIRIKDNLSDPWAWVYPAIFFALPLIFVQKIRKIEFYKKTWSWILPFIAMNALVALTREVRLFLPVVAYLFPLLLNGIFSLYNTNEN